MLETFMMILSSFQRKKQMRGKQIFYTGLVHPSQGFRKKQGTETAKMPPVKCLSWLWLRVSPRTKILQTLRHTLQARAGFVSSDCAPRPFALSQS